VFHLKSVSGEMLCYLAEMWNCVLVECWLLVFSVEMLCSSVRLLVVVVVFV